MNILYVIPNVDKVSGGPRTRINSFKQVFSSKEDLIIEKRKKLSMAIASPKVNTVYVESASNRIHFVDFFALLILRIKNKSLIVFIRDIYAELLPEDYKTPREKITYYANKISNFFLSFIATKLAFPTTEMGDVFYKVNSFYPQKPYFALPPGTAPNRITPPNPDFSKKIGILYLGSISYANAGFNHFVAFVNKYKEQYNFYVLSNDPNCSKHKSNLNINFSQLPYTEIPLFIEKNNIAFAFHTRPRNNYDDVTFPIKVLDFVSFQLPFLTEKHKPVVNLLSEKYKLYAPVDNYKKLNTIIQSNSNSIAYDSLVKDLGELAKQNTYSERYNQIITS